jgi:hypothetical protein
MIKGKGGEYITSVLLYNCSSSECTTVAVLNGVWTSLETIEDQGRLCRDPTV